jgi:hypothetical protein
MWGSRRGGTRGRRQGGAALGVTAPPVCVCVCVVTVCDTFAPSTSVVASSRWSCSTLEGRERSGWRQQVPPSVPNQALLVSG